MPSNHKAVAAKQDPEWFGWWAELDGLGFPFLFQYKGANYEQSEKDSIVDYLSNGYASCLHSYAHIDRLPPCPFGGTVCHVFHKEEHTESFMTDGVFVWRRSLVHLVNHHNVGLPSHFVERIRNKPERLDEQQCISRMKEVKATITSRTTKRGWFIATLPIVLILHRWHFNRKLHRQLIGTIRARALENKRDGDMAGYWREMNSISDNLTTNERKYLNTLFSELMDSGQIEVYGVHYK